MQESLCNVAKLKELFPSEKDSVLQATLSSCGDDLNKAASQLAGCQEGKDHFVRKFWFHVCYYHSNKASLMSKCTFVLFQMMIWESSHLHLW